MSEIEELQSQLSGSLTEINNLQAQLKEQNLVPELKHGQMKLEARIEVPLRKTISKNTK